MLKYSCEKEKCETLCIYRHKNKKLYHFIVSLCCALISRDLILHPHLNDASGQNHDAPINTAKKCNIVWGASYIQFFYTFSSPTISEQGNVIIDYYITHLCSVSVAAWAGIKIVSDCAISKKDYNLQTYRFE